MRVSWFDSYWVEVKAERIKGIKVGTWGPSWEGEVRATEEISEIEVRRESEEEVEVDWREGRRVSESKEGKRLEVDEVVGIRVAVHVSSCLSSAQQEYWREKHNVPIVPTARFLTAALE